MGGGRPLTLSVSNHYWPISNQPKATLDWPECEQEFKKRVSNYPVENVCGKSHDWNLQKGLLFVS
jgi:hypothetical protein